MNPFAFHSEIIDVYLSLCPTWLCISNMDICLIKYNKVSNKQSISMNSSKLSVDNEKLKRNQVNGKGSCNMIENSQISNTTKKLLT